MKVRVCSKKSYNFLNKVLTVGYIMLYINKITQKSCSVILIYNNRQIIGTFASVAQEGCFFASNFH